MAGTTPTGTPVSGCRWPGAPMSAPCWTPPGSVPITASPHADHIVISEDWIPEIAVARVRAPSSVMNENSAVCVSACAAPDRVMCAATRTADTAHRRALVLDELAPRPGSQPCLVGETGGAYGEVHPASERWPSMPISAVAARHFGVGSGDGRKESS